MEFTIEEAVKIMDTLSQVKGKPASEHLKPFLTIPDHNLAAYRGRFTDTMIAKVTRILRRRGCTDEHTEQIIHQESHRAFLRCQAIPDSIERPQQ